MMPALPIHTAEEGTELGSKVSVAAGLLGFKQRGGFEDGFCGRNCLAVPATPMQSRPTTRPLHTCPATSL